MASRAVILINGQRQEIDDSTDLIPGKSVSFAYGADRNILISAPSSGAAGNKLTISGGGGYPTSGNWAGGTCAINGGSGGTGGNGPGGSMEVRGGIGTGTASGGNLLLYGGASVSSVGGAAYLDAGTGGSANGMIYIGQSYATNVYIGRTSMAGASIEAGIINVGTTATTINIGGNTTAMKLGGLNTATIAAIARFGPSGNTDLNFVKELSHKIVTDDSTTSSTIGGSMTIQSGKGGSAGGSAAGVGGSFSAICGVGGDASATQNAGNGGAVTITAGNGGADPSAVSRGGSGGSISLTAGSGVRSTSAGAAGTITLTCGAGADSYSSSTAKAGGGLALYGGVGGKATGGSRYGNNGGNCFIRAGTGGAGDGDRYGGMGGSAYLYGGVGGDAAGVGAPGQQGGNAQVRGGVGGASSANDVSGSGGLLFLKGGAAGADGYNVGVGNGGSVEIDGGWATDYSGNTTSGAVRVGTKMYNDVFVGSPFYTTYINNSLALYRTTSASDYNEQAGDCYIGVTDTSANRKVYLLAATQVSTTSGRIVIVKDESGGAGTNRIDIIPNGSDTIDGAAASISIITNYGSVTLMSDGNTGWWVIAKT